MSDQAATNTQEKYEEYARTYARMSWRDSYWVIALIALSIGVLSIAASIFLDWTIHDIVRRIYASDILEGVVAVVLSGVVLVRMQSRRRELLMRMQIIEDVNHHVRNALTVDHPLIRTPPGSGAERPDERRLRQNRLGAK